MDTTTEKARHELESAALRYAMGRGDATELEAKARAYHRALEREAEQQSDRLYREAESLFLNVA